MLALPTTASCRKFKGQTTQMLRSQQLRPLSQRWELCLELLQVLHLRFEWQGLGIDVLWQENLACMKSHERSCVISSWWGSFNFLGTSTLYFRTQSQKSRILMMRNVIRCYFLAWISHKSCRVKHIHVHNIFAWKLTDNDPFWALLTTSQAVFKGRKWCGHSLASKAWTAYSRPMQLGIDQRNSGFPTCYDIMSLMVWSRS